MLTYFGDLKPVFVSSFSALKKHGRIIFSITQNKKTDSDWNLHLSGRFSHQIEYLKKLLNDVGFVLEKQSLQQLRTEAGKPVIGYIISARK